MWKETPQHHGDLSEALLSWGGWEEQISRYLYSLLDTHLHLLTTFHLTFLEIGFMSSLAFMKRIGREWLDSRDNPRKPQTVPPFPPNR